MPDSSESCTSTPTTGDCTPATLDPDNNNRSTGWGWDVIADAPGSYVLKTSVVSSSKADPDLSDNVATATVVVQPPSAGAVAATVARVLPARPRAGSVVVARVGVTAGGNRVRASAATCSATIGVARARTSVRVTTGAVTCSVPTPRSAHGKALRGAIAFSVQGTRVARAFSAELR